MIGTTLGPYELLEKVGEGGMGAVYRARDPRLGRTVAVKVLGAAAPLDEAQRRRFLAEARAASALEHPNIVAIHDVGEDGGTPFLVMEYVSGPTLAALTEAGRLPLPRALAVAREVASALERAHAAGIVHRDLKPSNVMLTADGRVKVLDFGLAKALSATGGAAGAADGATVTSAPATATGALLGTPGYMAPEQAEGRPVDARADVFAFGVLLFEMLTGRRAFLRDTPAGSLAALLRDELPPPSSLAPDVPPALDHLVELCTRKDRARRLGHLADVQVILESVPSPVSGAAALSAPARRAPARTQPASPRTGRRRVARAALAAAAVVALLAVAAYGARRAWSGRAAAPVERAIPLARLTLDRGMTLTPAISADGRVVAYASDRSGRGDFDLYVQQVGGQQALRLTDDPHNDREPAFSPDGTRLAFRSERDGGGLFVVDTFGGVPRRLTTRGHYPRWSPDGTQISYLDMRPYRGFGRCPVYVVAAAGGAPRRIASGLHASEPPFASGALWSPDGSALLFAGGPARGAADWWLAPLDGGAPRPLRARESLNPGFGWMSPGDWTGAGVVYGAGTTMRGSGLYRVRLDARSGAFTLPPERLASDSQMLFDPGLSREGQIVLAILQVTPEYLSIGLDERTGRGSGSRDVIPTEAATKYGVALSRDGHRIAYVMVLAGAEQAAELRIQDLRTGRTTVVVPRISTTIPLPRFTPDGRGLAYRDRAGRAAAAYLVSAEGVPPREVCRDCVVQDFFADGRSACVFAQPNRIVRKPLDGGPEELLFTFSDPRDAEQGDIGETMLSWDDRWLALELGYADGRAEIRIVPLDGTPKTDRDGVLLARDDRMIGAPRWSADGRVVYFLAAPDGFIRPWGQRVDPLTGRLEGEPFTLVESPGVGSTLGFGPRYMNTLEVGRGRLVTPGATARGNVWTGRLPAD